MTNEERLAAAERRIALADDAIDYMRRWKLDSAAMTLVAAYDAAKEERS